MDKKIYIIMLLSLIIVISCNKEESAMRLSDLSTPIITGYEVRDEIGHVTRTIGIPNIKLGDKSNIRDSSEYYFSCFPNPTSGVLSVYFKMPSDSILKNVWVTSANYYAETNTNSEIDPNLAKIGGAPIMEFDSYNDLILINFENFNVNDSLGNNGIIIYPDGFYRIYVQAGNVLLWDNIYLSKQ